MPEENKVITQTFSRDKKGGKSVFKIGDSYTSYSGCDIVASIQIPKINPDGTEITVPYVLGSLQTISISTYQDKVPVRAIGNMNAIDYTMGPRTIAGSLVFAVFDKHFADNIFNDLGKDNTNVLIDELPAFDITITYANEYGSISRMALYGVRIVEEGQVISINDVYTENTYKYCALSLERLNKQNKQSNNKMSDKQPVISALSDNNDVIDTPGKDIIDSLDKDHSELKEESIRLSVETENPVNSYKNGIAHFYLKPKQNTGYIHIYNLAGEKIKSINVYDNSNKDGYTNIYTAELKVGSYSAQYKNDIELKYSNTVNFMIANNEDTNYSLNDEPLYEYSNDDLYTFASNNKAHDSYVIAEGIYKDIKDLDGEKITGSISKSTFKENLKKPETYYTVFTYNKHESSKPKIILTEKENESFIDRFINFVKSNKDKLINDLDEYETILNTLQKTYNKEYPIIDNVLKLEKNKYQTELVYYAILFQNYISRAYNYNVNFFVEKNMTYPFFNSTIHNNVEKTLFFENRNKKDYFSLSKQNISSHTFLSRYGNRYFTYDISSDNYRSVRYDFTCLSPDDEYILRKYTDINTIKDVDVSTKTKTLYKKLEDKELIYAQLKEGNSPAIENLEEPYCKYDYNYNTLTVDVDYREELNNDGTNYYFAIKEAEYLNDYIPSIKIKFTNKDKLITIDAFSGFLVRDKYYFAWIEDEASNVISKTAIFSTYQDEVKFINYINKTNLEEKTKEIIKKSGIDLNASGSSIWEFLLVEENLSLKNLKYKMLETIYDYATKDINLISMISNLTTALLTKQMYVEYENVLFNKRKNAIEFKNIKNSDHVVVYTIKKDKDLRIDIYSDSESILLDKEGYTIAFVSKNKGLYRSDFIVIDNSNGIYIENKLKVSVI